MPRAGKKSGKMADLIDNPRDLSGRPWGRKRQENGLNRHHKRHHVGYPVVELSLRTIHTSHVSVASASAHSVSPRAFRARKLIPRCQLRGARRLWRAGEDLGATSSRCSPREFYPSLAYVRSPHRPLKYAGGCNADWSRACISSCLTSFSLPARAPARTILFPFLIQYPQ